MGMIGNGWTKMENRAKTIILKILFAALFLVDVAVVRYFIQDAVDGSPSAIIIVLLAVVVAISNVRSILK